MTNRRFWPGSAAVTPIAVLIGIVCVLGCQDEARTRAKLEAARVGHAIDLLRKAPNPAKPKQLESLRAVPCKSADVVRVRDHCAQAYAVHLDALEQIAAGRSSLAADAGISDSLAANAALAHLAKARQSLDSARKLMRDCANAEADLRRRYGL